ncbi:MAG: hypothetical protein EAZ85_05395 [Bacteroidetes bacterium]|nr:MAG: hypothetical protein EAZ85_05395 [Bacteroidota bacterium]TAG90081.1 MAG: hypothetical protein EAZ20_05200 [Bacteroidota bacterium]
MRYIFVLFLIIFIKNNLIFAQNDVQIPDSTLKRLAKDMCECFNERNTDGTINEKAPKPNKDKLQLCFGFVILKYTSELPASAMENQSVSEELGRKVAPFLMKDCPKFLLFAIDENQEKKVEEPKNPFVVYEGTFQKVETKNYTFITIKNDAGKIDKFLWLNTFKNDILFIDNPKSMKGKKIRISTTEIDNIYDSKTKKYISFKEIKEIEEVK